MLFDFEFGRELTAGDSVYATFRSVEAPSPTWTATLHLRGGSALDVIGTSMLPDIGHRFAISSGQSALLQPGTCAYWITVADDEERHTPVVGRFEVLPDPTAITAGTEQRSTARQMLDAIEALIKSKSDVLSFNVFGRSHTFHSFPELLRARREAARLVEAEDEAARRKRGEPGRSFVSFNFGGGQS